MLSEAQLSTHAERLLGRPVDSVTRAPGGGNNRLYRVCAAGASYALKYYLADERDRLGTEYAALRFLAAQAEPGVPAPRAVDVEASLALYDWIDGTVPAQLDDADLAEAFAFIARLDAYGQLPAAQALGPASAACLTPSAALQQLDTRLQRLAPFAAADAALAAFLECELTPLRTVLTKRWQRWLAADHLTAQQPLPTVARMLSPSDFGRHNMLRGPRGLVFVDFEYFGWDDSVKMVSDFALHPGSGFSTARQLTILQRAETVFAARDAGFPDRLRALIGLFGLIWCLILLNVYLPEVWQRRLAAGQASDLAEARSCQLSRAREFIAQLREVLHACQSA